jgi:hypothetical protein
MKKSLRKRVERAHLALCRLFVAQKRAMERGARRLDHWGDLDTQSGEPFFLRPSIVDMAEALDAMLREDDACRI